MTDRKPRKRRPARNKPPTRKTKKPAATRAVRAAGPARDAIKPAVIGVLARVSGASTTEILETHRLEDDLGLAAAVRQSLAPDFSAIVKPYRPVAITRAECGKLTAVKDAIDLVWKRCS